MNTVASRVLLGVLLESGKPITRTRLMKLLFLVGQNIRGKLYYDFLPYKFGPYSFNVDWDLRRLLAASIVAPDATVAGTRERFRIPDQKRTKADEAYRQLALASRRIVRHVVGFYESWSDPKLVDHVYERYPEYTVLSERTSDHPERPKGETRIYTLGYEGSSVDGFLATLIRRGIERVIDVRNNPLSRRYGFSSKSLSSLCSRICVAYAHFPQLGIPPERRRGLGSWSSYERLLDEYERVTLRDALDGIKQVAALMSEKPSVLVCFEAKHACCHRSRLAARLSELTGLPECHLGVLRVREDESAHCSEDTAPAVREIP